MLAARRMMITAVVLAPFTDTFNRANAAPLSTSALSSDGRFTWQKSTYWTGEIGISSSQLYQSSGHSGAEDAEYNYDFGLADQIDLAVDLTLSTGSDGVGPSFRGDGGGNHWFTHVRGDGSIQLLRYASGGSTIAAGAGAGTVTSGDTVGVSLRGNGITVTVNGSTVITHTSSYNATASHHGIHFLPSGGSNTGRIDQFVLTPV